MAGPLIETQNLTKSCNESLILASLVDGPKHGYQLALHIEKQSGGMFKFNHGTLYPILHKLEKDGLIEGTWSGEERKRKRKSYELTHRGIQRVKDQLAAWQAFVERLLLMLGATEK